MKKLVILLAALAVVLTGCSKNGESASADGKAEGNLVVWSFTDEIAQMCEYFKESHPDITIEYSMTPTDQFPNKLDPVLASGHGVPDVFGLEAAFVRKYVESGLLLDLTDIYEANKDKLIAYPVEVGTYDGKVYAMSWQAAPGAMFYRRSLAKKYLGTDDPAEVQKYFTDFNKFLETAQTLKDASSGKCVVVSTTGDLFMPIMAGRKDPWVVNDKLVIDPAAIEYMEMAKTLRDNGFEGRVAQWSEGWFAGMKGSLKDENGNAVEVFSYFLPTWGLHYTLKPNAPETSGDWAMIPGPVSYRWGGTWIGAYKDTKNPAAAKEFIRYLTCDDGFMETWATSTGDLVSNLNVVNKIKDTYSEPFLNGQNHYAEFAEMAQNVNGKLTQGTDQAIEGLFQESVTAYVMGEKSRDQALADFQAQVSSQLGL